MRQQALQEYTAEVTSELALSGGEIPRHVRMPYTFVMGKHEAAVEYCRSRGIHPALFKPVVCWPNLAGYGIRHGYTLTLVHGWSEVEDYERVIKRARLFGFRVVHA